MIVMWLALLVGIVAWMVGSVCAFLGLYDACLVNMAMSLLNLGLFAYRFVNKQTK